MVFWAGHAEEIIVSDYEFEEEEFTTQFNGQTLLRVIAQAKPHWPWLIGFLLTIALVAALDSYFTFLGKRIIDKGIQGAPGLLEYPIDRLFNGFRIRNIQ